MQLVTDKPHPAIQLLREVYAENDMNQSKTAKALGVSQGLVSHVLNGYGEPGEKLMRALADYTGKPYEEVSGKRIARSPSAQPRKASAIGGHPGFDNAADVVREVLGMTVEHDLLEKAIGDVRTVALSAELEKVETISVSILLPFVQAFIAIRSGALRPVAGPLAKK